MFYNANVVLVHRKLSAVICGFGIVQLFTAVAISVCGFASLGLFNNTDCVGIWCGLPMTLAAVLCVVVFGTRHRLSSATAFIVGIIVLAVSAYHAYYVYEEIDFWEDHRDKAEYMNSLGIRKCYNRGDNCVCESDGEYRDSGYRVQFCDQFRTGEELFWTMFILTLVGIFFTLLTTILSFISLFLCLVKGPDDPLIREEVIGNGRADTY